MKFNLLKRMVILVISCSLFSKFLMASNSLIEFEINGVKFAFVVIPAGTYTMGSPEDEVGRFTCEDQREIKIDTFMMMIHEVTQQQWEAIMGKNRSRFRPDKDWENYPVENVNYDRVQQFINKLNNLLAEQYFFEVRLPTEEEWKYAARAGTTTKYFWGNDENKADDYAWHNGNSENEPHPVATRQPNPWGLHDMIGNLYEWTDSFRYESVQERVICGGSFSSDVIEDLSLATPGFMGSIYPSREVGFRLSGKLIMPEKLFDELISLS